MKQEQLFANSKIEKRVDELLSQMTLEEKIGQLNQIGPSPVGGFEISKKEQEQLLAEGRITQKQYDDFLSNTKWDDREDEVRAGLVGSFLGMNDAERCNRMQKVAVEESRLGIPLLFGLDVIHGHRTVFPIPLAESCTFDDAIFEKSASVAAAEASSEGINWTFAPMIDISRDARWGRIAESMGEDTYLASRYAAAKVRGFQGENFSDKDRILACAKHFAAYGAAIGGRDYNTVDMSLQTFWNYYLPPFIAAANEGVASFMSAFNSFNGKPCTLNSYLLRDVLREKMGFKGFVVSDACSIAECVAHGSARDKKDAAEKALKAGVNIDMVCGCYIDHLKELVEEGKVSEELLDSAVREVLRVKFAKGLFEDPYIDVTKRDKILLCPEFREAARDAARKSIVLLKNNNVLPLSKKQKIAVVGSLASAAGEMLGTWTHDGKPEETVTLLEGINNSGVEVKYAECCGPEKDFKPNELLSVIKDADVVVACVGETVDMSGEASSKCKIDLPGSQMEMLSALKESGKPFVTLLFNGRPLAVKEAVEISGAVLECWHLGSEAGNAIADVLFGCYNPSGRLTATFPNYSGEAPIYYNHESTGRPTSEIRHSCKYMDAPLKPLFPFGFGLSYTEYEYSDLSVAIDRGEITAEVTVKNIGNVRGEETVQLYITDVLSSMVRPVKELKGYQKVTLQAGESKKVILKLNISDLGFYNEQIEYTVEPGEFKLFVGHDSQAELFQSFWIDEDNC